MNKLASFLNNCKYYFIVVLITLLIVACDIAFPSPGKSITEPAHSTEAFINSIGVNVHLGFDNTSYMKYDDVVKPMLKELGVRHIRTNIHQPFNKSVIEKVKDLANIGIKSIIVTNPELLTPSESVEVVKSQIEGVSMVEGPNEWNINPEYSYKGQSFPQGVINFQKELYSAIKNDPVTAHLDVIAPSLSGASSTKTGNLIFQDVERLKGLPCDINNMHSYPAGELPTRETLDTIQILGNKRLCGEAKPIIATETGYNNAINLTKDKSGISETAAAKYINRLFLEYFNRGVKRTYTYELIDIKLNPNLDEKEKNWGLLRADGARKGDFKALRNLLAILQDSQIETSTSLVSDLDYNLKGDLSNVHHTLLQKQNGIFYLIFWQEVSSYDNENKVEIKVLERKMVLIPNTKIKQVKVYRPFGSKQPFSVVNNPQKINFTIPDHTVILELIPH
jgi:hypothetical protein